MAKTRSFWLLRFAPVYVDLVWFCTHFAPTCTVRNRARQAPSADLMDGLRLREHPTVYIIRQAGSR
jgi:hypothetical protein